MNALATSPDITATTIPEYSGMAGRILQMLGDGHAPVVTANALGVSESYVSQLLAEEHFAQQVAALRYETLAAATKRDASYDELEDKLLRKLSDCLPLMFDPMKILKSLQVINAAKRRGVGATVADGSGTLQAKVVNLVMPTIVVQKFVQTANGQVVQAGGQTLVTADAALLSALTKPQQSTIGELSNEQTIIPAASNT